MKLKKPVDDIITKMREYFVAGASYSFKKEDPFRGDLLSSAQMESHGIHVASQHKLLKSKHSDQVIKRLNENEEVIKQVQKILSEAIQLKHAIAPASEWFLDNLYLIKEQVEISRKHLPRGYSLTLPVLAAGSSAGMPRVYDIALEIISHSDGRVDLANLFAFMQGYQKIDVLTIGELWAIPIMLRFAIIENIRRIASRIAIDRIDKNEAIIWAEQLIKMAHQKPNEIIIATAEMAQSNITLNDAFIAEFSRLMQGKGQGLTIPLSWIEQQLSETGHSIAELISMHNQNQAADQVSIRNSIESIRLLKTTEWKDFVENVSEIEKILKEDITGTYSLMDFNTRDWYRHVIEWLAKKSKKTEREIASLAIELTKAKRAGGKPLREQHVGYFLIDEGRDALIKKACSALVLADAIKMILRKSRFLIYSGTTFLFAMIGSIMLALCVAKYENTLLLTIITGLLCFVLLGHFATVVINWLSTFLVKPKPLPKLDFSNGIPISCSTIVAVPCLISSISQIGELVNDLEVRYLSNPQLNIFYCLLTDFSDAPMQNMQTDEELLHFIEEEIDLLNLKYKGGKNDPDNFYLLHRSRKWNNHEKVWMGYERKRGKLGELNSLLRNTGKDDFSLVVGNIEALSNIKYVITLDADTLFPRESAWKMIATMAHPLNNPVVDKKKNRVVSGYGILQPRTAVNIPDNESSIYAKMHSTDSGLDPYTQLVSDVYQDLFSEGSFIGKGIYDIDVFEQVLGDTFPENRILSHDLLEGSYVRSGLLTDVQLLEDYPETYWADVNRRHRWIRGDWQIASWGLPFVPDEKNKLRRNYISSLSKWKIFDNLKRSLMAPASFVLLTIIWLFLTAPLLWTIGLLVFWLFMPIMNCLVQWLSKPKELDTNTHLIETWDNFKKSVIQIFYNIVCLPFEACTNVHAIFLANWRLLLSKRRLLQWTPYAIQKKRNAKTIIGAYRFMWPGILIVLLVTILLYLLKPSSLSLAFPFLLFWFISPIIVWKLSQPMIKREAKISEKENVFLQVISRKIWAFFEDFVTAEDNYLPPDNYQETPVEVTAHRTSPTNIGLSCLVNLSAYDFGYISVCKLIERTKDTFDSLHQMERYKGHLYNWYATTTLQPLLPKYISVVDSGNFVANMLVLKQGLLELPHQKIFEQKFYTGLHCTLNAMFGIVPEAKDILADITNFLPQLRVASENNLKTHKANLNQFRDLVSSVKSENKINVDSEIMPWLEKLESQIVDGIEVFTLLTPWVDLLPLPAGTEGLEPLEKIPSITEIRSFKNRLLPVISKLINQSNESELTDWLQKILTSLHLADVNALQKLSKIEKLINECAGFADVDYDFLYDESKHLFYIGYNVTDDVKDTGYYDILASEARLGIYTAIAQGKISQDSWFALGRLIANNGIVPVLLSWSGSMFEYLMPDLIMPTYENTLLQRTSKSIVQNQIDYGKRKHIPWGISESGYNLVDANLNYQYQAFGVPGLGLKRGLGQDLVIAPYATLLALMVDSESALKNLTLLSKEGFEGRYGFYEAIDYTASRMPRGKSRVVIKSFMAHHQGMGFLSLARVLLGEKMQQRFCRNPQYQSALLLLKERVPKATNYYTQEDSVINKASISYESNLRLIKTPNTPIPEVQLLSNGQFHLAITNAGGNYRKWKNIAITRWREDITKDNWGTFCYIKELNTGEVWSNTYQPTRKRFNIDETIFSQGHVEFRRVNGAFETKTDIVVSPEDDTSIERVKITNRSNTTKVLEVTGYTEIAIASQAADEAHPAFSNLFVQTKINKEAKTIIYTRRGRSKGEQPPWMFFMMLLTEGAPSEDISYESDRLKFLGRSGSLALPQAVKYNGSLSGTFGSVLDPVAAIKYRITLSPRKSVTFEIIIGIAETYEDCMHLIDKNQDKHLKNRAFELSWTHSQVLLRQINATESEAQLFNIIAGHILFSNNTHRANDSIIANNKKSQSGLWGYSISGDLPIVLIKVGDSENTTLVRQLIKAHTYWRMKGLSVDLVVWNEDFGAYRQLLHDQILGFATAISGSTLNQPGGIYICQSDQLTTEDRILFQTVAKLIFSDDAGALQEQMNKQQAPKLQPPALKVTEQNIFTSNTEIQLPLDLLFNNQTGGFTQDGKEYYILTTLDNKSPLPWVNVIANRQCGTVVSESGASYTWAENAHSYRLTPWENDPVFDKSGEAFYIRDEISGKFWSPSPFPSNSDKSYITRHGFGYSIFEHMSFGIKSEMQFFVDTEDAIKFTVIKLKNNTTKRRQLSVFGYVEWVLGDTTSNTKMYVVTQKDLQTGVLFAHNNYSSTFPERVAFFDADGVNKFYTCDRTEFIGRNGILAAPEALLREKLSNKYGAALDPCTAIQIRIDLFPSEEKEVVFRLGSASSDNEARALVVKYKRFQSVRDAQSRVNEQWNQILGKVVIKTPDPSFNVLVNGWLEYQTIACRVWGRSGLYQSGGAFGFRDQLQDVLALLHVRPDISRAQILLAASRQFKEGDVQHWWHPPTGRGVRTACSDDYLWLPYVVARYMETVADTSLLDEYVSYIQGRALRPEEESYYDLPVFLNEWETVYNHCKRAINYGLKFGIHGLPLIGTGDWNDGMDKVGELGKGESVWLGFFLYDVLMRFSLIANHQGDEDFKNKCINEANKLRQNIDQHAWDGNWYRRAYFDDGTPLGSSQNEECQIDSISQSWSVISGAGNPDKISKAMASLNDRLIDRQNGIIKLLTPAFDKSDLYPGYIKGYVPGVRENGGQYTHAAIWAIIAFAILKDKERVWELFSMINPVNHTVEKEAVQKYKVEPYVMAADVYGVAPHEGRGGWTWYTGSAGWTYQLAVEHILGLQRRGNQLYFYPCIPDEWEGFEIQYQYQSSVYAIHVQNKRKDGGVSIFVDNSRISEKFLKLQDDGKHYEVVVEI